MSSPRNNTIWLMSGSETPEGVRSIYNRVMALEKSDFPWILVNVCCSGSLNADYSNAILDILLNTTKPIKTQTLGVSMSFGILYSCLGEERWATDHTEWMHHSYALSLPQTSLEDIQKELKKLEKMEDKSRQYLKKQLGVVGYNRLMKDFKSGGNQDMYFESEAALHYNIIQNIGIIQPLTLQKDKKNGNTQKVQQKTGGTKGSNGRSKN